MDNYRQIEEIREFRRRLSSVVGREVDSEVAASIWIRKYAHIWRLRHPRRSPAPQTR